MLKSAARTIDEYIADFPEATQTKLQELRQLIHQAAPGLEETISYMMPTFKLQGKAVVYFGGFKKHIGFFPFPSGVVEFQKLSKDYATSKGTVQLPLDKPLPKALIQKVVAFRLQETKDKLKK